MNAYSAEFYDPLAIALDGASLQEFVDEVLAKYNRLDVAGFVFNNDLLTDFTYAQIQKEYNIDVMATYVDPDSPAIPVAVEPDVLATGKIPRMKAVEYYNEDKLRKLKMLEDRRSISREALINKAGEGIADIFVRLVSRHTNSLSYQRDQIVSTGKLALTDTNNPNGISSVEFSSHIPAANKKSYTSTSSATKRWWTSSTHTTANEGADSNIPNDLRDMAKTARKKGVGKFHFEMNDSFIDDVLGHSTVLAAIGLAVNPGAASSALAQASAGIIGRARQLEILGQIVGAPIVARDGQARVEKFNTSTGKIEYTTLDSFAKDVVVCVPDGTIGEILTVEPILLDGGDYAFAYDGKLAITIGKDYVKKCQSYNSEMTSLAVVNVPKLLWYLNPCEA